MPYPYLSYIFKNILQDLCKLFYTYYLTRDLEGNNAKKKMRLGEMNMPKVV